MLAGIQFQLSPEWQLRSEIGFINRTTFSINLNYRFGIIKRSRINPKI